MARAEIQKDVAHRLLYDAERVRQAVDESWDEDQRHQVNNLAARLARDPQRVAALILKTKHGTQWALEQWRGLAASATENGGLTEPQRQLGLDLKGVSLLSRDNTATVPAAGDKEALLAFIAREVQRLETRLVLELNGRDSVARGKTRLGLLPPPDAATRKYKSDEARAHKRYVWAFEWFHRVRMGLPTAGFIDPATGRPVPGAGAGADPPAAPAPAAAASGTPTTAPAAAPEAAPGPVAEEWASGPEDPVPVPDGLSAVDREMMMIAGAAIRDLFRKGLMKPPAMPPSMSPPPAGPTSQGR